MESTIREGVIFYSIAIKLCNTSEIEKVSNKLVDSCLCLCRRNFCNDGIEDGIEDGVEENKSQKAFVNLIKKYVVEQDNKHMQYDINIASVNDNKEIENIKINVNSTRMKNINKQLDEMIASFEIDLGTLHDQEKGSGLYNQNLLLAPIIARQGKKEYFITVSLTILNNGYGVLRLENKISDVSFNELSKNNIGVRNDSYIFPYNLHKSYMETVGYTEISKQIFNDSDSSIINCIMDMYIKGLENILRRKISTKYSEIYNTLYLFDYDNKPSEIDSVKNEYKYEIMKLVNSPIKKFNMFSSTQCKKLYDKCNFSWTKFLNVGVSTRPKIVVSTIGDCLSEVMEETGINDKIYAKHMYNRGIIQSVLSAHEHVEVIGLVQSELLDLISDVDEISYNKLIMVKSKMYEIENNIMWLSLQKYGTMTELIDFIMQKQMVGQYDIELDKIKDNFLNLMESKKEKHNVSITNLISFIGVMWTAIMSCDDIWHIIKALNLKFMLFEDDIQNLTIATCSCMIILFLVPLSILFLYTFKIKIKTICKTFRRLYTFIRKTVHNMLQVKPIYYIKTKTEN